MKDNSAVGGRVQAQLKLKGWQWETVKCDLDVCVIGKNDLHEMFNDEMSALYASLRV